MGLTTKVQIVPSLATPSTSTQEASDENGDDHDKEVDGDAVSSNGARLVCKSSDTSNKSRKEEDETGGHRPPSQSSASQ